MTEWPFGHLQMFGYDVAVVDPPTQFELYSENGNKKSASAQYKTMSWESLGRLPVGQLVRGNGIILLWACPPTLRHSFGLFDDWGARYKTELVWPKGRMGTGYRSRGMHESVLLGVFGDECQIHDAFYGEIRGKARDHSRKPDEFYEMVIDRTPGLDRCELFARQSREGFVTWGDEATKFDTPQPKRSQKKQDPVVLPLAPAPLFDRLSEAA